MDATRARRTRDRARQGWYARHRQWRFARYLGFVVGPAPITAVIAVPVCLKNPMAIGPGLELAPICSTALTTDRHSIALTVAAR
jgi:hypothetical protein